MDRKFKCSEVRWIYNICFNASKNKSEEKLRGFHQYNYMSCDLKDSFKVHFYKYPKHVFA